MRTITVEVEVDPSEVLDDLSTEELEEELERRMKNTVAGEDVFAAVCRWIEVAPAPLADDMRAWLFRNAPPRRIDPAKLDGLTAPIPGGRSPFGARTHSLNPPFHRVPGGSL